MATIIPTDGGAYRAMSCKQNNFTIHKEEISFA